MRTTEKRFMLFIPSFSNWVTVRSILLAYEERQKKKLPGHKAPLYHFLYQKVNLKQETLLIYEMISRRKKMF
jgi:hypothetical protein